MTEKMILIKIQTDREKEKEIMMKREEKERIKSGEERIGR